MLSAPKSLMIDFVVAISSSLNGSEISTTWTNKSASVISSNVDLNASIKYIGRLLTNPTVSVKKKVG